MFCEHLVIDEGTPHTATIVIRIRKKNASMNPVHGGAHTLWNYEKLNIVTICSRETQFFK